MSGPNPAAARSHRSLSRGFVVAAIGSAVLMLAAGACSSNSKTPAATATGAAHGTPASSTPGTPPAITPVDPSTLALQTVTGPFDLYTVAVPAGWSTEDTPLPNGAGQRYVLMQNGGRVAQVTVQCMGGATVDSMLTSDSNIVSSLKGQWGIGGVTDAAAGGLSGKQTQYTLVVGGQLQQTRVVYLQGKNCGWHLLMQAYGGGAYQRYAAVFDRVLDSFREGDTS